jgi:ADP-ribose pyrophosphatase YjhB (NUDIX family)
MKFCSACGHEVQLEIPDNDDRERHVCGRCKTVHYSNPKIIVGCLPVWEGKVLLCKRAIEPRFGKWTLPAGFMENQETTAQGAARETWEEARAKVKDLSLYYLFDVPAIDQVYLFYLCELETGEFGVGPESIECGLFSESEVPWDELAFPVVIETLKTYFSDAAEGKGFPMRVDTVIRRSKRE